MAQMSIFDPKTGKFRAKLGKFRAKMGRFGAKWTNLRLNGQIYAADEHIWAQNRQISGKIGQI